jgi:hypothetical protein
VGGSKTNRLARTAYHEPGHAVVAICERIKIGEVSMRADHGSRSLGRVTTPAMSSFFEGIELGDVPRHRVESHVLFSLAGREAEKRFCGRYNHAGSQHDWNAAVDLLIRYAGSDEEVNAWMDLQNIPVRQIVERRWADIELVATALLSHGELSSRAIRRLLQRGDDEAIAS